jgi:DNA repair ATPase RecN
MADAWHALQKAVRALRKESDIRSRLAEAYRALTKLRAKDLPHEMRPDYEWLLGMCTIDVSSAEWISTEIHEKIRGMSAAQLSEAVNRIEKLHNALRAYQPAIVPTSQKRAACRVSRRTSGELVERAFACVDCTQSKLF